MSVEPGPFLYALWSLCAVLYLGLTYYLSLWIRGLFTFLFVSGVPAILLFVLAMPPVAACPVACAGLFLWASPRIPPKIAS